MMGHLLKIIMHCVHQTLLVVFLILSIIWLSGMIPTIVCKTIDNKTNTICKYYLYYYTLYSIILGITWITYISIWGIIHNIYECKRNKQLNESNETSPLVV